MREDHRAFSRIVDQSADRNSLLWMRLAELDGDTPAFGTRLTETEFDTLMLYMVEIANTWMETHDEGVAMVQGLMYGFQFGHDFVLRYGRIQ